MNSATIQIPGTLTAKIERGRITGYVFNIAANDAGYFGPNFIIISEDIAHSAETSEEDFISDAIADSLAISQDRKSAFITVELGS